VSTAPTATSASSRTTDVLEDLEQVLLAFMRKHRITHEQYRVATQFLVDTVKQGEESLLYDVFFEAESTDIGNRTRTGSPEAIEGPFYLAGAPELQEPFVMPMRDGERGDVLFFMGKVRDVEGKPVAGAELDVWHADADGLYSNIHPNIPPWNLRARFKADSNGTFEVRTIVPPPYEIPKDGPTGQVLKTMGRHFFRPAHLHVKVRHPVLGEMTSQIYFLGGQYLDSDVANAVRDGLVATLMRHDDEKEITSRGLDRPYYTVAYEFELPPGH
jgi:catechol 1,2-dioxygenase